MGNYILFWHQPDGVAQRHRLVRDPAVRRGRGLGGRPLQPRRRGNGARIFQSDGTREQALLARLCCDLRICGRDLRHCAEGRSTVPVIRRSKRRLSFSVLKFLATTFASISEMPGGIFSPSLAVGAGLGSNIASLFHGAPLAAVMLLGMVSYFAGVVQAPITAFVIVTEMTDDHAWSCRSWPLH